MASSSTPNSLRDLYAAPPDGWSFIPAPEDLASSGTKNTAAPWPSRSARSADSHVFDLAPVASDVVSLDLRMAIKALIASGVLQYATTAIAMPFEVGKVLLQIQWIPKDHVVPAPEEPGTEEKDEDALSDASGDSYFHDPDEPRSRIHLEPTQPRLADEEGYVVRRSVSDKATRPQFIIPIGPSEGVWGMMKRVGRWQTEGWLSLWKAQLTSCTIDVLSAFLQPVALSLLSLAFMPNDPTLSLSLSDTSRPIKPLAITVASHLITGIILSPLDLVRTRLIAQTSLSTHKTYSGPVAALRDIYHKEGGLAGMYLHPNLLIPTVIENVLRPLLTLSAPLFIERMVFVTEESHPVAYQVAELLFSSATLLLTLPIETARRRLQIQTRGSGKFQACVETRPSSYTGVADVLWKVLTEERSMPTMLRRRRMSSQGRQTEEEVKEKGSWINSTGIGQLYRGFGMGMGASGVVFLLATLAGGDSSDAGWAEL
ncbi:carrier protein [Rhizoctonia solani 123E]|uniref:Carrier protein n=1 Tax=Rhizoctonia solani 123E TaxID=1423351 RepID=A0A074S9W3_9AGAM|nr:carrier protein [Rhizoctonia solani 123E]